VRERERERERDKKGKVLGFDEDNDINKKRGEKTRDEKERRNVARKGVVFLLLCINEYKILLRHIKRNLRDAHRYGGISSGKRCKPEIPPVSSEVLSVQRSRQGG